MIRFIEHKNIDKQKWDACIDSSSNASIFVYSWYMDIVCENWDALILNNYEAVFPLASRSKYKINYLYQPYFTRYFGVYSAHLTGKLVNDFIDGLPPKYKYAEFCLHESNSFKNNEAKQTERYYQLLELQGSYLTLQKNYSDNAKRNIKKAIRAGFNIRHSIKPELIVELFRSTKGQELEIFKPKDYKVLITLMNRCIKQNNAQSISIYGSDNKLHASGFFMKHKDRFIFLKSGVTEYGKANGAMHLLFDSFIQKHAGTNQILDFGGSSVGSVARFYKNFGAKDCVYLQLRKNNLPGLVKWLRSLKK